MSKRFGRVTLGFSYVVDLDNDAMVDEAKECILEDISNLVKFDFEDVQFDIKVDKKLTESDVADFLKDREGYLEDEVKEILK